MSKKNLDYQPTAKGMYAWTSVHAGSFVLFVESLKDCHKFLFLPGPSEYYLTFDDFTKCMKSGVLEFVESLPDDIFEESVNLALQCPSANSMITANEKQI